MMRNDPTLATPPAAAQATPAPVLELQGYSYAERHSLLPQLTAAFTHVGGWVLERRTLSASTIEFRLELQLRSIPELYAALIAAGVELTRTTHNTLTDLCTCRHFLRSAAMPIGQVLTLRLELSFLEDVTLHSLLMTGCGLA